MAQLDENRSECKLCPHHCNINRFEGTLGYCKTDQQIHVSSVFLHKGEEPVISGAKGICNVFFSHCNMQCVYCQNEQISKNNHEQIAEIENDIIVNRIMELLPQSSGLLGFVSPSHQVRQMLSLIQEVNRRGLHPAIVYNTNAYDDFLTLKSLETVVDIYLPDFKYANAILGEKFSRVKKYPEYAIKALKEMLRQKGTSARLNNDGIAESGVIVRHLVLPGYVQNSIDVLNLLSEEFGTNLNISLMAQYMPVESTADIPGLNRTLYEDEYLQVVEHMENIGFYRGWIQDMDSASYYNPDFKKEYPFS